MRAQDRKVFVEAAAKFDAWILVRRTNPASLPYIGRTGYVPKRIDCKPKTADFDVPGRTLAGLVADPVRFPQAFSASKLADGAVKKWQDFVRDHGLAKPGGLSLFAIDENDKSPHFGCLMMQGKYIHGDYDLYDIILMEHPRGNIAALETLHGVVHMRGPRLIPIQDFINERIHVPVIQHGCCMQYEDHSKDIVDAFGPHGEQVTFHQRDEIKQWYEKEWQRVPLVTG
ncbi:MAG: hypothetical protein RIS70_1725 [Planctomycetota bacterium]